MNNRFQNVTLDDAYFDRLVDGEFTAAEYRKLLAALDDEPGGWRRCATAFLEAQAWRHEMTAIRRGQEPAPPPKASVPAAASSWRRWLPLLAVAASFVVAFFGGLLVQRQFGSRWSDGSVAVRPDRAADHVLAHGERSPQEKLRTLGQEPDSLGNIRLVVDGGQGNQPQNIDVPVYDLNQLGAEWLAQERSALPADVIESLRRRGRIVERQIEYLPLPLDDQHEIVLPVEQIQITPVSRRSY